MALRPRWRKVVADLWENRARSLLVVASIAVGVFAIGMIFGSYAIISQDLRAGFLGANAANITVLTDPLDDDVLNGLRRMEGVAEAEARRTVNVRLWLGPESWDEMALVAAKDYADLRINLFEPLEGSMSPGVGEVVLERRSMVNLGARTGDSLEIELTDGTRRALRVVGVALDPTGGYAAFLGEPKGFIHYDTIEWLRQPPYLNRLHITVSEHSTDEAHLGVMATRVTDRLERTGRSVYQVGVSSSDEHPLASLIEALLGIMGTLGVLVVFLSGALVANTMSALLSQHLRHIGVMKLVGARRAQVVTLYLVLIVAFGLIALSVAVPLGSLGAYGLSLFAASIVNFGVRGFRLVPFALLLQVAMALVVPPLAGLWPVLTGSRVTVQRALGGASAADTYRPGPLSLWLQRVRWVSRPLLISLRNTFRRRGRLGLTLLTLTLGGAVFIAVFNTQVSLNHQVDKLARYFLADVNVDLERPYRVERVYAHMLAVPGVASVEAWAISPAEWLQPGAGPAKSLTILAPPSDTSLVEPVLLAGRWLAPGESRSIAVSEAFWSQHPGLAPGDSLPLRISGREADWTVVGIFQYSGVSDLFAYTTYEQLHSMLRSPSHASLFRVVTTRPDPAFQDRVTLALDEQLRSAGFQVRNVESGARFVGSASNLLGVLTSVLLVMAVLTALVGSIGLAGTMSMNVMERTREIGVLRTIGAHDRIIAKLVIVEGQVIGLISYLLAAAVSFPITALLSNVVSEAIFNTPASFGVTANGFLVWLAVVLVLASGASMLPARMASRLTIREVLAYE